MKPFLQKSALFSLLVLATVALVFRKVSTDFSDRFYYKFTYPAPSMVVGSSRALLGLEPETIERSYPVKTPLLNFAFTQATSPYGETYYDAIEAKLEGSSGGTFIVEVAPAGISEGKGVYAEKQLILGRMKIFNLDPNVEYIARNNERPLYMEILFEEKKPVRTQVPHASGWLENLASQKSGAKQKKIKEQTEEYKTLFANNYLSDYRTGWLEKTIQLLSKHGRVLLLRMPVSTGMREMENTYCPDFTQRMQAMATRTGATFVDFSQQERYEYADLHHMTSPSAKLFSKQVADTLSRLWPAGKTP